MADRVQRLMRRWVDVYRERGLNPLPSDRREKKPLIRYKQYYEALVPLDVFDRFDRYNIQVMTGRRWGLMVIDLDGGEAIETWEGWVRDRRIPRTWESRSGLDTTQILAASRLVSGVSVGRTAYACGSMEGGRQSRRDREAW